MINILIYIGITVIALSWIKTLAHWPRYPVVFDVSRFGAFPNGKDITSIIQSCIAELPEHGIIFMPQGNYKMNGQMFKWSTVGDPDEWEASNYAAEIT